MAAVRIKSAYLTLKEVQRDRGPDQIVKYGFSECMKVKEALKRCRKVAKEKGIKLK